MAKVRTTLTVDDSVLKAVKVRAARLGKGDSELIEDALRSHLGLDLLDRIWATADMSDADAMDLAVEAQRETRSARGST